jgi:hypothetical protein
MMKTFLSEAGRIDRLFAKFIACMLLILFGLIGFAWYRSADADDGDPINVSRAADHHIHKYHR